MIRILLLILMAFAQTALSQDASLIGKLRACADQKNANAIVSVLNESKNSGLPLEPLENKILEGLAKGQPTGNILRAVLKRQSHLMKILDDNKGIVPPDYLRQLYVKEKNTSAENKSMAKKPAGQRKVISGNPLAAEKKANARETVRKSESPVKDTAKFENQKPVHGKEKSAEEKIEKQEKALKKMENREKAAEKRIKEGKMR